MISTIPIRDRVTPGIQYCIQDCKWLVDPGLDGDVYAEKPYLYGPAASSVNTLHIRGNGEGDGQPEHDAGLVVTEGGDEDGVAVEKGEGVPESEAARKKHFF